MLEVACLCGRIRVGIDRRPDHVHACNCTLCRKTGAWWGYFHPSQVTVEGAAQGYRRADKAVPSAEIRFCATCGATTHFNLTADAVARFGNGMMGVNLRLADETALAGVELRFPDGRGWSGEGGFDYVRPARILGAGDDAG